MPVYCQIAVVSPQNRRRHPCGISGKKKKGLYLWELVRSTELLRPVMATVSSLQFSNFKTCKITTVKVTLIEFRKIWSNVCGCKNILMKNNRKSKNKPTNILHIHSLPEISEADRITTVNLCRISLNSKITCLQVIL